MVLATTALLLQFLAIPTTSLSTEVAEPAQEAPAAASETDLSQPKTRFLDANPATSEQLLLNVELASNVTYAPGRLVPERVLPVTPVESPSFAPRTVAPILSSEQEEQKHRWEQRQKKIWLGMSILSSGAATFDAWSTRRVISSGRGHESNPLLRPFAKNDSLYAAIQVGPLLLDYLGRLMMTSEHAWMRQTWWIPQAMGTAASIASGINNLRVH